MRVLAITNIYPAPDRPYLGIFVQEQVNGLRAAGADVDVLFVDRQTEGMKTYFRLHHPVRERVERFRPDVIHVMYGGVMAERVVARAWGRPVVVTFQGSDLLGENLSGLARKLISRVGIGFSLRAAGRADGVVIVARSLEERLPRSVDRGKIRVIPCGIDLDRFVPLEGRACRRELGWTEDTFHILASVGDPMKRPELARAAAAALRARGVACELHFLRGVPNADVPRWLGGSHVFLMTSLQEGSPTIVKEALACSVPVVSVDVGDVAERIDGIRGCWVAKAEATDLAEKLGLVAARRERVDARHRLAELSHVAVARRLLAFYAELSAARDAD